VFESSSLYRILIIYPDATIGLLMVAPAMFDETSDTRQLLASRGITFSSEREVWEWIIKKDVEPVCRQHNARYGFILQDHMPPDGEFFFDAYEWKDDRIQINLGKAYEVKKTQFRALRAPQLEALDKEVVRALEDGHDITAIKAKKQALRDVTLVEMPTDILALKDFIPDILTTG